MHRNYIFNYILLVNVFFIRVCGFRKQQCLFIKAVKQTVCFLGNIAKTLNFPATTLSFCLTLLLWWRKSHQTPNNVSLSKLSWCNTFRSGEANILIVIYLGLLQSVLYLGHSYSSHNSKKICVTAMKCGHCFVFVCFFIIVFVFLCMPQPGSNSLNLVHFQLS